MKRKALIATTLVSLACAAPAAASGATETITTTTSLQSFPAGAPYTMTYGATFGASGAVADAGTGVVQAHFGAVPSPSTGVFETFRTLTGSAGTLVLHCSQLARDFSVLTAVPDSGRCAVLSATGAYAGLHGSGPITGVADLVGGSITDTVVFGA